MAKQFPNVATMQDVYEYARDSYLAASKQGCIVLSGENKGLSCYCPVSAPQYQALASKIQADMASGVSGSDAVLAYKNAILAINSACRQEAGWVKPPTTAAAAPTTAVPDMPVNNAGAGGGSGFPWWAVLLIGGGLLYYLSTRKKSPAGPVKKKTIKRKTARRRRKTTRRRKPTRRRRRR